MTETDLMDPVQLNELLMAVSGAEDSFALLTNEELYGNVKSILDLQKDLTGQAQEELQLTPEKWQDAVTKVVTEEPVITVEVEDHATDAAEKMCIRDRSWTVPVPMLSKKWKRYWNPSWQVW